MVIRSTPAPAPCCAASRSPKPISAPRGALSTSSRCARCFRGVSRQRIAKQTRDGSLLAVPGPSNRRYYPTVQFQPDGSVVPRLKAVTEALATRNPWAILNFLVQPDDRLNGRTPMDRLKAGAIGEVVDAARSLDQQGT